MLVLEESSGRHDLVRALGPHTSISYCGGCDLIRCSEGEHAFKVKVGEFHGNIRVGESAKIPSTPGELVSRQVEPALQTQLADSA